MEKYLLTAVFAQYSLILKANPEIFLERLFYWWCFFCNHTVDCYQHCTVNGVILYLSARWFVFDHCWKILVSIQSVCWFGVINLMFGTADVWDKSPSFYSDNFKIFQKYTWTIYRKLPSQTRDFYYLVFYVPKATVKALNPDKPLHQFLTECSK